MSDEVMRELVLSGRVLGRELRKSGQPDLCS
jgi:hypothetical protein